MAPEPGSEWRTAVAHPGDGAPTVGTVVRIREVVPASEPGANAFDADGGQADAVVVEWDEPVPVWNGESYDAGSRSRAWALSEPEFAGLFEEA